MSLIHEPKLADPDALDTVPELRRELHRANAEVHKYWAALGARDASGRELITLVNSLLMQHVRGDHRGVAAILDAQLNVSQRLREKIEEANECAEIRQVSEWAKSAGQDQKSDALPPYNCEGIDPWSKMTVLELRRVLDVANRAGVCAVREAKGFHQLLEEISKQIAPILMAHIKGDRDALSQALSAFCAKYVFEKGAGLQKVH